MFHYLDVISLNEFEQILLLYDIILDRRETLKLLLFLRHNMIAIYRLDLARQLSDSMVHLTDGHMTCNQALDVIIYFYATGQKKT